jgi:hypothetical protein
MYNKYETRHLPVGSIELSINKTQYQLGEVVGFTLTNHFPVPVYVTNQCPSEPLNVYRWENKEWVEIHATAKDDAECYTQDRNIAVSSEGTRSYDFGDWPQLFGEPGVYRIAAAIDHYGGAPFQDFVVLEPAKIIEVMDPPRVTYEQEDQQPVAPILAPEPQALSPIPDQVEVEDGYWEQEREYEEEEDDDDD